MQFKRLLAVLCVGLILVSGAVFAQNARVAALGAPSTGMSLLIDDVSDILNFPADVVTNTDMVQGAVGVGNTSNGFSVAVNNNFNTGYVYASKSLMSNMAIGVVFGKPSYLAGSYIPGTAFGNTNYVSFMGALNASYANVAGFFNNAPGTPANVGHLLLGMDLSGLAIGLDLFREAANSTFDSDGSDLAVAGPVVEEYSNTGALGAIAGINMGMGEMEVKASAGIVLPSHDSKTSSELGTVTEATLITESAMYLPVSAKLKMPMGDHKLVGAVDFSMSSYKFKPTSTGATYAVQPSYANMHMGLGVGDEIKIGSSTTFFASLGFIRSSTAIETDDGAGNTNTQTTVGTTLPGMAVGIEQTISGFWKIDEITLRAGGSKNMTWTTVNNTGDENLISQSSNSGTAVPSAFAWTTGLQIVKGKFELDLNVDPTRWNGVDFISDTGPVGGNITMTYNFGGGSSSGGGMDYSTPSYEAPAPMEDTSSDDVLDF